MFLCKRLDKRFVPPKYGHLNFTLPFDNLKFGTLEFDQVIFNTDVLFVINSRL